MSQEFVLRRTDDPRQALQFALAADGTLSVEGKASATLEVLRREGNGLIVVRWGEHIYSGAISREAQTLVLTSAGRTCALSLRDAMIDKMEMGLKASQSNGGMWEISSPIPGLVKAIRVKPGEQVEAGQLVAVLEAMKMENEIVSPHKGSVASVDVKAGQVVSAGTLLMKISIRS